jgi:hypothetical protein
VSCTRTSLTASSIDFLGKRLVIFWFAGEEYDGVVGGEFAGDGGAGSGADAGDYGDEFGCHGVVVVVVVVVWGSELDMCVYALPSLRRMCCCN